MEVIVNLELIIKKDKIIRRVKEVVFRRLDIVGYAPFIKADIRKFNDLQTADIEARLFPVIPDTGTLKDVADLAELVFDEVERMTREGKTGEVYIQPFTNKKLFP